MIMQVSLFAVAICVLILSNVAAFAQTPEHRQVSSTPPIQAQSPGLASNANSIDTMANEIALLRKSLQTLNARLREISEKVPASEAVQNSSPKDTQNRISLNLELLARTEQRAEILRRQLFDLIEKETSLRSRLMQIEEDMRPESIERNNPLVGSTRTAELRDVRRRILENDRKGFESLLNQTTQGRIRLDDDVKQADALVTKLRQRLFPLIDKEIEKITPN